ncbi:hypothetical protein Nepgr_006482 [Nepenthes gracilis]|uniref:Complex 1 LYR protein domain-containing protein n=1 Tax=Nepenthes gracilis TaxID=150966 RepID=A0AAD3S528_NEPGR|nr:hypothetical protein Nepgr_006482 [Nepenthes gracilis]
MVLALLPMSCGLLNRYFVQLNPSSKLPPYLQLSIDDLFVLFPSLYYKNLNCIIFLFLVFIWDMTSNLQKCLRVALTLSAKLTPAIEIRWRWRRALHDGPDTIEELLDRHLVKKEKQSDDDDESDLLDRRRLTSTRREALSLYRDILRATRFFMWPDSRGVLWRDILRANARKEFEQARFEKDPEVVTRLLIGGRDAVQEALDKLVEKQRQEIEKGQGGGNYS